MWPIGYTLVDEIIISQNIMVLICRRAQIKVMTVGLTMSLLRMILYDSGGLKQRCSGVGVTICLNTTIYLMVLRVKIFQLRLNWWPTASIYHIVVTPAESRTGI